MKLVFVGDVMLGRLVNDYLQEAPLEYPWGDTLGIFQDADFRFCNLECVISDKGEPWTRTPKVFHFRSDAKNIETLKAAKIDTVSLANNHVLDYSKEALADMLRILRKNKILYAGAGEGLAEAKRPAIINKAGSGIELFAVTDNEPDWQAGIDRPGTFYLPMDIRDKMAQVFLEDIKEEETRGGLIAVSLHWGGNWGYEPPRKHIDFAHALVDTGADIVLGTSPHVFRGIEIYKRKPIFYSLGDFIDVYAVDDLEPNDESFIFEVEIEGDNVKRIILRTVIVSNFQANLAAGSRKEGIMAKMVALSRRLGTRLEKKKDSLGLSKEIFR
ncbi:MAG: capsular biosynthesis protein [Fibrobacteres bacterium CG2_30_45_31]|nr:MAG: capsular biosynthesis protein [Fibrobacteres bacterium CG2_30_45_31]